MIGCGVGLALAAAIVPPTARGDDETHAGQHAGTAPSHDAPAAATKIDPGAPMTPETGFIPDSPRRMPDGSFFVPKPSQRLLTIRTVVVASTEVPRTDEIPGHVIADPNASGEVQSHQTGRIEPVEGGMPLIGTPVTKGQILAYVIPTVSRVERGTIFSQAADLAVDIAKEERKIAFLQEFLVVPFRERKLEAARFELEGLRKRYEILTRSLSTKVALRASVDGVIASVHATTGQIVESRQPVFDIVDPQRLLVEATAIDANVPEQIRIAFARTTSGVNLPLKFIGRGPQLRDQAILLMFAIDGPAPPLSVGTAVTVMVQGSDTRSGIALPRESVVRAANGETIVWEKINAERFVARPVRVQPIDGEKLSVLAGLAPGARAVTNGAAFLNNVR